MENIVIWATLSHINTEAKYQEECARRKTVFFSFAHVIHKVSQKVYIYTLCYPSSMNMIQ